MGKVPQRLAAIRDVLRHLDHPNRLSTNPLVSWKFREEPDIRAGVALVRGLITRSLDDLSARRRAIVVRCDLRGEPHETVAAALGISERHFYRERRAALEALACALENASRAVNLSISDRRDELVDVELCFADTAYQAGNTAKALQVLRLASDDAVDKNKKIKLECRMAELSCEAGTIAAAHEHVLRCREICAQLERSEERRAVSARIDAMDAVVLWRSTPVIASVNLARRATAALRARSARRASVEDVEALALATIVQAEHDFTSGAADDGRRKSLEALEALSLFDSSRAILRARLRAASATALMYDASRLESAQSELKAQQRDAVASGLALEATLIGWRLSNFHRFSQSHDRAVAVLRGLLPVARQLLPREERAGMCLDLASAQLVCGDAVSARRMIVEAKQDAVPHGFCHALAPLIEAEACLLEGAYHRTLQLCDEGITAMSRLKRSQSIVNGLRLQAEANYALGDVLAAKHGIGAALETINGSSHPIVIAKTHRTAARITGRERHRRLAEEIFRSLRGAR